MSEHLFRREDEDPADYERAIVRAFNNHEFLLRKEQGESAPRYWLYGSAHPFVDGTGVGWEVRDDLTKKVLARHETREQAQAHADTLNDLPRKAFHWRDGLWFRRMSDGSVVIVRAPTGEKPSDFVAVIDAGSWGSIVAATAPPSSAKPADRASSRDTDPFLQASSTKGDGE